MMTEVCALVLRVCCQARNRWGGLQHSDLRLWPEHWSCPPWRRALASEKAITTHECPTVRTCRLNAPQPWIASRSNSWRASVLRQSDFGDQFVACHVLAKTKFAQLFSTKVFVCGFSADSIPSALTIFSSTCRISRSVLAERFRHYL